MYQPAHFVESRPEVLQRLIREHPFGLLVTDGASGLAANGVPFLLDPDPAGGPGVLRAHVARANPVWKEARSDRDSLVVFQGAAGLHLAGLVPEQGRARQGGADLELHRRPGARCGALHRRCGVAARLRHPADRRARGRPHGRRGRSRRAGLGGERCAGRLCGDDAEGDRRRRDSAELAGRQMEGEPEPSARRPRGRRRGPGPVGPETKRRRWRKRCATPGTRRDLGRAARALSPRRAPAVLRRGAGVGRAVRGHHGAAPARLHRLPRARGPRGGRRLLPAHRRQAGRLPAQPAGQLP